MRIGIDARFYGRLGKGLGRYTEQLLAHLEAIDDENEYYVFLRRENFDAYQPKKPVFRKVLADIPWYGWKEQVLFLFLLKKNRLDLVHFPHFNVPIFYPGRFVVTIHDLILLHHNTQQASTLPRWVYALKFTVYKAVLSIVLRRAFHILTVSQFTKDDILSRYMFVKAEGISVTHQAGSRLTLQEKNEGGDGTNFYKKYGIIKPYLLYVGNSYPHKNLDALIRSFLALERKDLCLVLVGKKDAFYQRLIDRYRRAIASDRVLFVGDVDDRVLDSLYRHAHLYVFVSLYEGFGLPPLEAMERSVPVVSSCVSSMPEILGDAAKYCDPYDEKSITQAMATMLDDETLREQYVRRGRVRAKRFSWKKLARKTLDIYKRCGNS